MKRGDEAAAVIQAKYLTLQTTMNEALRRRWAAAEAQALGRGGVTLVSRATGISMPTLRKGIRELATGSALPGQRIRQPGGGRKPLLSSDPTLLSDLQSLLAGPGAPSLYGSPLTPARIEQALRERGHRISTPSLLRILGELGYRTQPLHRTTGAAEAAGRWAYIRARTQQFQRCGQPVLAIELQRRRTERSEPASARPPSRSLPSAEPAPAPTVQLRIPAGPTLLGAALRCLLELRRSSRHPRPSELLVLVAQDRQPQPAGRWRVECKRLAEGLGMRVQILLLPSGVYRWGARAHVTSCELVQSLPAGVRRSAQLELGVLAPPLLTKDGDLAAELYAAAYPQGLISDDEGDNEGDNEGDKDDDKDDDKDNEGSAAWSFCSRDAAERRRPAYDPALCG